MYYIINDVTSGIAKLTIDNIENMITIDVMYSLYIRQ